jgi:predicted nucleic acid-binding protein
MMLLDTSGLYCYLDAGEARHERNVSLLHAAGLRLTHNFSGNSFCLRE